MTLPNFVTGLEMELRLRSVPFDLSELSTFAGDVWPLAAEDPDPTCWAEAIGHGVLGRLAA
jgi:hypothetical protein